LAGSVGANALAKVALDAYFLTVLIKQLVRFLTLLALLTAPFGMLGGPAAAAETRSAEVQAAGGHCVQRAADHQPTQAPAAPAGDIDCMMACACMPPLAAGMAAPPLRGEAPEPPLPLLILYGLSPQAEPPPPRLS